MKQNKQDRKPTHDEQLGIYKRIVDSMIGPDRKLPLTEELERHEKIASYIAGPDRVLTHDEELERYGMIADYFLKNEGAIGGENKQYLNGVIDAFIDVAKNKLFTNLKLDLNSRNLNRTYTLMTLYAIAEDLILLNPNTRNLDSISRTTPKIKSLNSKIFSAE